MWQQANNTADGRLSTKETDPANKDTRMYTIISCEEGDALLSEDRGEDIGCNDDSIPNARKQERKRDTANELKKPSEHKIKEPAGSEKTSNDRGRKRQREEPPKSAKITGSSDRR